MVGRSEILKKVCILSIVDLSRMTLLTLYTEYMDKNNIEYDLIYVNKFNDSTSINATNIFRFDAKIKQDWSISRKVAHYWKMRKFATKIFDRSSYDFIIVWNEVTSFLFADILKKKYAGHYCINIRDYFYNNIFFVKMRLIDAISNSSFTTISSDAFRKYLPKFDYTMVHSLNRKLLNDLQPRAKIRNKTEPIRILYIGQIGWFENLYKFIDEMANDTRYEIIFAGTGSEVVSDYIKDKEITNIKIYGRFEPDETSFYLKQADVLYNLYGCGFRHVDTALSIKFYYAVYLKLPILAFENTYMQEMSCKYGIGFSVKENGISGLADDFFEWYHSINQKEIVNKCDSFLEEIEKSHENLIRQFEKNLA